MKYILNKIHQISYGIYKQQYVTHNIKTIHMSKKIYFFFLETHFSFIIILLIKQQEHRVKFIII